MVLAPWAFIYTKTMNFFVTDKLITYYKEKRTLGSFVLVTSSSATLSLWSVYNPKRFQSDLILLLTVSGSAT